MTAPTPNHEPTEANGNPRRPTQQPNPIMQYFQYEHLPQHLRDVSEEICILAQKFDRDIKPSAEKHSGLRKLLEAKDCLVRASLTR